MGVVTCDSLWREGREGQVWSKSVTFFVWPLFKVHVHSVCSKFAWCLLRVFASFCFMLALCKQGITLPLHCAQCGKKCRLCVWSSSHKSLKTNTKSVIFLDVLSWKLTHPPCLPWAASTFIPISVTASTPVQFRILPFWHFSTDGRMNKSLSGRPHNDGLQHCTKIYLIGEPRLRHGWFWKFPGDDTPWPPTRLAAVKMESYANDCLLYCLRLLRLKKVG